MKNRYLNNNAKLLIELNILNDTYILFDDDFYNGFVYATNYFNSKLINLSILSKEDIQRLSNDAHSIYGVDSISYSVEFIEGIKGAYEAIIELCYPNQEEDIFL